MGKEKPKQIFEASSRSIAIATVVILLAMFLLSSFLMEEETGISGFSLTPDGVNPAVIFKEGPIEKNKELQLQDGERYTYGYLVENDTFNITYQVIGGPDCTVVMLTGELSNPKICLDRWGNDQHGYDSAFEEPAVLLFKPWMLALGEGWRWDSSTYLVLDSHEQHIADAHYRVMRTENYRGRLSYVVEISSDGGPSEYEWIDDEKRVVLKIVGHGYALELVDGLEMD